MNILKILARKLLSLRNLGAVLRLKVHRQKLKFQSVDKIFIDIYRTRGFGGKESISGTGSDIEQTRKIVDELPAQFRDLRISTILDIPCGDFHWMKDVDLAGIDYVGADIVADLVARNKRDYGKSGMRFERLDLMKDKLPKMDLIFCRDCLVHLCFKDIFAALENVCKSRSVYFLTTTFTGRKENSDILTGQWRVLNLEARPFRLPKPMRIIVEGCMTFNGDFRDKALGLWRMADIEASLKNRRRMP